MSTCSLPAAADACHSSVTTLLARWRQAVASSNAADPVTDDDEEALAELLALRDGLAQRIRQTVATSRDEVNAKLEVLAWMLEYQRQAGAFNDCRDIGMVASIRADFASIAAAA